MLRVETVLVPTDFSRCADQALYQAADLASQAGATLHLLHVSTPPGVPTENPEAAGQTEDLVQWLREEVRVPDLEIVRSERRGFAPAPEILAYAEEIDADIIAMGTHGRRGLGAVLIGSVAAEVVRRARCPVVTVREQAEARLLSTMQDILVPVDFSDFSRRALRKAAILADTVDATLQLLHVVDAPLHPSFYAAGVRGPLEADSDLAERCRLELTRLAASAAPECKTMLHVREGHPAEVICDYAQNRACDLIFIATHGLTGLQRFLLGSVTEKVVTHAPCPVFVVKSFGKSLLVAGKARGA